MPTLLLSLALLASPQPDTLRYVGHAGELTVTPPRIESPSIDVDGRLDEPEWQAAAVLTGFSQYTPNEGVPATEETEVRVFYAPDAIYFGFHVYDDPARVLVHRTERDRSSFGDDWVRIMLDTFDDERQAFAFFVNAFGIQTDGMWLESIIPHGGPTGPKVDFNPDFIWDSQGRVVDDGWVAEIRIPYVSLRFPDREEQEWGLQVARGIMRNNFKSSWAPLTQNVTSVLAQSGRLVGLRGLRPKRLVELNPVITGKVEGARLAGGFERGDPEPEAGLNARVGITPNLTLDATVNPDFSQVEADADQIQVNERFALFFPEKRIFFLEGADIFRSTQALVHTRRIVDPIAGAKLTGKVGETSVAYLGAVDESPGTVFGSGDDAVFNLLRVRRDIGAGSTVGLFYTDRTIASDDYNRVLSGDARLLFGGRYQLEAQLTGSWTSTGADGGSAGLETATTLNFMRAGRDVHYSARFQDITPGFRTLSGFMPRVGDAEFAGVWGFDRYGDAGALLERWGLELRTNDFWDHDELWEGRGPDDWEVELWPSFSFRDARSVLFILRWGGFRFQPEDYAAYQVVGADGKAAAFPLPDELDRILGVAVIPNLRINDVLTLGGPWFFREVPLFAEGSKGWETQLSPNLQIRASEALRIDASYSWQRLWRSADDTPFSTVHLPRVRVQYQWGRSLIARFIGQYDLEKRVALRHPQTGQSLLVAGRPQEARSRGTFQTQALVSYEPSPGTIFFLGYSRLMEGPYGLALDPKEVVQDGFFVKLSYLFRL